MCYAQSVDDKPSPCSFEISQVKPTSSIISKAAFAGSTPLSSSIYLGVGADYTMTSTNSQYNVAVGKYAMRNANGDSDGVAVGYDALAGPDPGGSNTAIGSNALKVMNGGSNNVGLGYVAGNVITTGSNNIIIGSGADPSANNASNQIVIGYGATGQGNNFAVIGNSSVDKVYAAQDGAAVIYANATINDSDLRLKTLIKPVELGLQFIKKLNPVSYFKMSKSQFNGEEKNGKLRYEYGLIAQDVDKILKESDPNNSVISKDSEGFYGMDYKQIIMPLINAVQEQQETIESQNKEIAKLNNRLEKIEEMLLNSGK